IRDVSPVARWAQAGRHCAALAQGRRRYASAALCLALRACYKRNMFRLLPLLLLAGCATAPLRPVPERLQPWATTLRDQQPEDAFAAVYRVGARRLVFVAAQHANQQDSLTFRIIREAYAGFAIDSVIAEGFPTSRGPNSERIFRYVTENGPRADGFVEAG